MARNKPVEDVKRFFWRILKMTALMMVIICFAAGCGSASGRLRVSEADLSAADMEEQNFNYGVSARFAGENIEVVENDRQDILNTIEFEYGEGGLFLDMLDEENGSLLYCGGPATGQMTKFLYSTSDRWRTYDRIDISAAIDGYPTSLCVLSTEHFYIGTQMRSNGYLFETTDGGENWESVPVDNGIHCRYGYVPVFDGLDGAPVVLLECEGTYYLYEADARRNGWNKIGSFEFEPSVSAFFAYHDAFYIAGSNEKLYLVS